MPTQNHGETASQPRVTIAVPAYRNPGLRECLKAIAAMDATVPFETIVVLNDATAEVRAIAQDHAAGVRIAEMPVNLGVSGAFNQGFALGTGEFLLELQDDSIPDPDLISVLVARAEAEPDAGAVGALTVDEQGEVSDPGWIVWRDGVTSAGLVGGSRNPDHYVSCRAVDYHGSAGMLLRRSAWESVSGLDDSFYPAYYGDVDLCFRLRTRGWRVILEPRARVQHAGSMSTSPGFREFVARRLREQFIDRHRRTLEHHGEFDPSPSAADAELARAATAPRRPAPPPPTPDERSRLRARLDVDALAIAKRERDVHAAYADHVRADAAAESEQHTARIANLEHRVTEYEHRLTETQQHLCATDDALQQARAELDDTHTALQDALRSLHQMSHSKSWRYTRWLRRVGDGPTRSDQPDT